MSESQMVLLVFDNSADEDVNYAKAFWQSAFLTPHIESNLVCDGIRQRLKTACPLFDKDGNEIKQRSCYLPPLTSQIPDCHEVDMWQKPDPNIRKHIKEVNERRKGIMETFHKQQLRRITLEAISRRPNHGLLDGKQNL